MRERDVIARDSQPPDPLSETAPEARNRVLTDSNHTVQGLLEHEVQHRSQGGPRLIKIGLLDGMVDLAVEAPL